MKKFLKFLLVFTTIFAFNTLVNAEDYELKELNSIKMNGEHEDRVFMPVKDFYEFINSETDTVYEGKKEVLKISDGQYKGKDYVMCVISKSSEDQSEGPYDCLISDVYYPTGSNVIVSKDTNIEYSLHIAEGASLVVNEGATLKTNAYFNAYGGSKVDVNGVFKTESTAYVYGNLNGKIEGNVFDIPESPEFKVESLSNGNIKITITNSRDYQTYDIYRATSKKGKYSKISTLANGESEYIFKNGKVGSKYYFKLKGFKSNGNYTAYTKEKSTVVKYSETTTANAVSTSKSSIKISWDKVDGATGYAVYRSTSKNGKYSLIKSTSSLSYTNKKLTTGKKYYYKVRPYITISKTKYYGKYSQVTSAYPKVGTPVFTVSSYDYNINKISITKVSGANGYAIYRSDEENGTYKLLSTTTKTVYYDKKLTLGKKYYYKVKAYALVGKSKKYGSLSEVKNSTPTLKTPNFVVDNTISRNSLTIKITKVNGATSYKIYKVNGETDKLITTTNELTYTDSDVTLGNKYTYKVVAVNKENESKYNEVTKTVKPAVLYNDSILIEYNALALGSELSEVTDEDDVVLTIYRRTSKTDYSVLAKSNYKDAVTVPDNIETDEQVRELYNKILTSEGEDGTKAFMYIDSDLTLGETYSYKLTVTINGVESEYSNIKSSKIVIPKPETEALMYEYNKVLVGCDGVSGADGYEVYRATSKKGKYTKIYDGPNSSTITTGTFNKTYYYKQRAYKYVNNKKVYGAFSSVKSIKVTLKQLQKYPIVVSGADGDATIKSVKITKKRVSGDYVYYTFKINFKESYMLKNVEGTMTVNFLNYSGDLDYTYKLTSYFKKGKRKNFSETFTIKIPKTSVYYYFGS